MIYRNALAERRRIHSEAPWQLSGVVVGAIWFPAAEGIEPASVRMMEAGLVGVERLPAFLAPNDQSAVEVAISEAERAGYGCAGHEITTEII